ncbi:hypothetical protein BDM02DRAFT_3124386 [Thelephora ganbajun]|uniref:Uncharacterized protein n=1 Tax=Thelephora ganbajun TaxID=370292 RepID=A0ACB6YYV3_THEGA|nr:hypothetical protein BDM02DRAFT_3124386 [Thelephora ganbajun]
MSKRPTYILDPTSQDTYSKSAVFGVCGTPPSATWGSDQVLASGWYNGSVNIHDLRASTRLRAPSSASSAPHLLPVLTFVEPSAQHRRPLLSLHALSCLGSTRPIEHPVGPNKCGKKNKILSHPSLSNLPHGNAF